MSWNNVIPASVIHEIMDDIAKEPKQLHFDEAVFPTCFMINEEYLTTCNQAFQWVTATGHGPNGTVSKHVDHPAFAAMRLHLSQRGFIEMQTQWFNGDRVLKPFFVNKIYFAVGDKFPCASALGTMSAVRSKRETHYDNF